MLGMKKNHRRNLFGEAAERGYLVKNREGEPYRIRISSFSAGLVDLTNPGARTWIKDIIKEELIGNGASGWMADFGEGLPYDAVLFSGADPKTYHDRYAEEWARVNREAIREAGRDDDIVFFNRSGYIQSPRYSTLFWVGDQLVDWDEHDGIKSAVTGLLTSGLSGYSLEHSDIGGYTAIDNPLLRYHRSKELLLRWIELGAFTAVFRTHEGNIPEVNHQFYSDEETLEHFVRFAKIYAAWKPYRMELVKEASETGLPVVRHPFIHYPQDPEVLRPGVPVHGRHRAHGGAGARPRHGYRGGLPSGRRLGPPLDGREARLAGARRLRDGLGAHRGARRFLQGRLRGRNPFQGRDPRSGIVAGVGG